MKISLSRLIQYSLLILLLCLGSHTSFAKSFLWKVESKSTNVYLLGSVHMGVPSMYPMSRAIQDAYKHEQFISGKIGDLMTIAREEKDYSAEPLLAWFVDEQIEEEASTGKIAEELEMIGDGKSALLKCCRGKYSSSDFGVAILKSTYNK